MSLQRMKELWASLQVAWSQSKASSYAVQAGTAAEAEGLRAAWVRLPWRQVTYLGLSQPGLRLQAVAIVRDVAHHFHQQRRQKGGSVNSVHCSEEIAPASSLPWQPTHDPFNLLLILPIKPTSCQQAATLWSALMLLLMEGASTGQMSHARLAGSLSALACPAAGSSQGV